MNLEKRIANLENLVNYLVKQIDNLRFYTNADTEGNRQNINNTSEHLSSTDEAVDTNSANIDYVAMMTEVELPEV